MMCLLSLGKRRRRRHGPLITSGFFSTSGAAPFDPLGACSDLGVVGAEPECESGIASLAGVSKSLVDLDGTSDILLMSVPGVGGDANSLYELSVIRGIFQGKRRKDMQQKIMASDQISGG
jgi:hypothetical protein